MSFFNAFSPASVSSSPEFDCFSPSSCHSSEAGDSDALKTPYTTFYDRTGLMTSDPCDSFLRLGEMHLQDVGSEHKTATIGRPAEQLQLHTSHSETPDISLVTPEKHLSSLISEKDPFSAAFAEIIEQQQSLPRVDYYPVMSSLDMHVPHYTALPQPDHTQESFIRNAQYYSDRFPVGHKLGHAFMTLYELGDELGSGGFGFVMVARHRTQGHEVAVKFIIKDKVPSHAWMEDEVYGKLPTEVMLLSMIDHEHIVKCLDLFEDHKYYYLVQELHGSSWVKFKKREKMVQSKDFYTDIHISEVVPSLSPSGSQDSIGDSLVVTPSQSSDQIDSAFSDSMNAAFLQPPPQCPRPPFRPRFSSRASYDLFECIESTKAKCFTESQAGFILAQVVEAVYYLDCLGIAHRDVKDENIVIDKDFKVKLIDFGSAIISDPKLPRPYYDVFYGTTAYASPEILLKRRHQAAPAEVWTIGVLLSYLLTGMSPFRSDQDTLMGHVSLADNAGNKISSSCLNLLQRCLHPDPYQRATISEVRNHPWLMSASVSGRQN